MLFELFQMLMALYVFTELFKPVLICFVRWNISRTLHCPGPVYNTVCTWVMRL